MKHFRFAILICLVLLPALSRAAGDGYGYPIEGPYAATILGTPPDLKAELPAVIPVKELVLDLIPDLKRPPVFYYDDGLRCSYVCQKQKAPLVFLIAGTGASHQAPKVVAMMKALYQAGFHVVTLSSPTHPNFIISASHSHVPGDLTEDAADLYWIMENVWSKLKEDIEVSEFYLGGYSLGGTQAAFVAKLDEERKTFNFRKVLMVNPAVNLYNSVSQIEGLLNRIPGGEQNIARFFNDTINKFTVFFSRGQFVKFNDEFLYAAYKEKLFTPEEAGGMIGVVFRFSSAAMIFDSDVMTNGGYVVPKNRTLTATDSLTEYFRVCAHLSFLDYFNEYFYPHFLRKRPGLTKEALIAAESLKSIEGYLKSSPKFGVMTNENDFILATGELEYLRQLFGDRAKIYPRGGHMGNLEYKDNMAYLVGFFKGTGGQL